MVTAIAVFADGPLRGSRREIQTDHYGRVPDRIEITTELGNTHIYLLDRSTHRARAWTYEYQPRPPVQPR